MNAEAIYLDSSAIVKLIVAESESIALERYLVGRRIRFSCALARVEVVRSVWSYGPAAIARAQELLDEMYLIRLDDEILTTAAVIEPASVRSLDAIHLAAAASLGSDLATLVTYDRRMAIAAARLGMVPIAPTPER